MCPLDSCCIRLLQEPAKLQSGIASRNTQATQRIADTHATGSAYLKLQVLCQLDEVAALLGVLVAPVYGTADASQQADSGCC